MNFLANRSICEPRSGTKPHQRLRARTPAETLCRSWRSYRLRGGPGVGKFAPLTMSSARGLSERAARISSSRRSSSRSRSPARSSAGGSLLDRSRAMSSSRASYRGRSPARPRTPERRSPGRRTPERRSSLSSRAGSMSGRPESPARASLRRAQEMQSRRASSRACAPHVFLWIYGSVCSPPSARRPFVIDCGLFVFLQLAVRHYRRADLPWAAARNGG